MELKLDSPRDDDCFQPAAAGSSPKRCALTPHTPPSRACHEQRFVRRVVVVPRTAEHKAQQPRTPSRVLPRPPPTRARMYRFANAANFSACVL
mmetsp:Transcript_36131/g.82789  ORF Transcript_36131/g.82789 Transcript_36131/m.82789 type:complete len:93 (+) Transcript_36131:55-333(+)|eukprot:CAMPEP_0184387880 /NCGR_PEP_ID=MMETSP0007-20130409/11147_1 /TAXON_ID=97485 /ORGANISM="Prymnesium parvum, Strain Texoma1" /LENGTH=92 /DNA_ID=CAMNT_0026736495 /DNA_START=37 /DNA_END=315 /DNA_ORIENTATION=-